MRIDSDGLSVEVPKGWDAAVTRPDVETFGVHRGGRSFPVLHVANFALPPKRGDYGSGAVEIMGRGAVLLCLLEFEPAEASSALFARKRIPRRLSPRDFSPDAMQRSLSGMSGAQFFGVSAGRALCLYAVLGSHARRSTLVPEINRVLATLRIR